VVSVDRQRLAGAFLASSKAFTMREQRPDFRMCSPQVFKGRGFFFGELDIFSIRGCGLMASGENPVAGDGVDFGQSDNFCVKKIRRLQINDPNTNCGNLHDETKRLYSALAADCRIELTDTERVGLIRRLLALKVSVPLFAREAEEGRVAALELAEKIYEAKKQRFDLVASLFDKESDEYKNALKGMADAHAQFTNKETEQRKQNHENEKTTIEKSALVPRNT
jgi:hypothetical protein